MFRVMVQLMECSECSQVTRCGWCCRWIVLHNQVDENTYGTDGKSLVNCWIGTLLMSILFERTVAFVAMED